MNENININIKILPFGRSYIELKGNEVEKTREVYTPPQYTEPKTTNPQFIEVPFCNENYIVPETTGGYNSIIFIWVSYNI